MVPICKKIRSKSISISRKIIINTYLVWEDHSILLWVVFFLNNGLVLQWYRDSTATRIAAETVISKVINLPISINRNVIGIATFYYGSEDNWARSEISFATTTKTTSTLNLYCHGYSAVLAINVLFIGY